MLKAATRPSRFMALTRWHPQLKRSTLGIMTGSVKQDGEAMAATIASLVTNIQNGEEIMANTDQYNVDSDSAKIRVPYSLYTAEG